MHVIVLRIWGNIWWLTLRRNRTNATNVKIPLLWKTLWRYTWNVILERNHLSVTNTTVCVTAGILRSHNKTHFGGKLYICKQWDYASLEAGNLRRHSKIHSGEKPYKCNQCHFASAHAYKLKYHLKTHSGENLSNVAYVSFLLSRQMVWPNIWKLTLEKSHTGVTNNQCDYTSIRADYLRKHLRSHPVWRQYNIIWQQTVKGHFSKSTREKIFQE